MENYLAAFVQRSRDVRVLHENGRYIAAMHMGGVAVECLLKHLIFVSLPPNAQREWKTDTNNPGHIAQINPSLFERTASFDKLLNERIVLIRGQKGTGKSTLYHLFLHHKSVVDKLTAEKTKNVICVSGHGSFRPSLGAEDFRRIDQAIQGTPITWDMIWRVYLLLILYAEGYKPLLWPVGKVSELEKILEHTFDDYTKDDKQWQIEYTNKLLKIATNSVLYQSALEAFIVVNSQQKTRNPIWVFYDELEEAFSDNGLLNRALSGLLRFIENPIRAVISVNFKLFLRESTWESLIYDRKTYFNGRDLVLQWTKADFLRFVLHRMQKSDHFHAFLGELAATDTIDNADEEQLERALQLLWGSRLENDTLSPAITHWLYGHITDSSNTTFPHIASVLLKEAIKKELQTDAERVPSDRLLAVSSLREGLLKASQERCREIRETYPELQPFFTALAGKNRVLAEVDLRKIWQSTVQSSQPDFVRLVNHLQAMGIIKDATVSNRQAYLFMDIYADGFGMENRVQNLR